MRVLVTGDRNWKDTVVIWTILNGLVFEAQSTMEDLIIREGCARGADQIACEWYDGRDGRPTHSDVIHEHYPADWHTFGRAAGPKRNKAMFDAGGIDLVVAFHNDIASSKGTAHSLSLAGKHGIRVWQVRSV